MFATDYDIISMHSLLADPDSKSSLIVGFVTSVHFKIVSFRNGKQTSLLEVYLLDETQIESVLFQVWGDAARKYRLFIRRGLLLIAAGFSRTVQQNEVVVMKNGYFEKILQQYSNIKISNRLQCLQNWVSKNVKLSSLKR